MWHHGDSEKQDNMVRAELAKEYNKEYCERLANNLEEAWKSTFPLWAELKLAAEVLRSIKY